MLKSLHTDNRLPHAQISTFAAHCTLEHWFQLPNHSLSLQATPFVDEAFKTIHLRKWKAVVEGMGEEILSHCLQPSH